MFVHVEWAETGSASSWFEWTHAAETKTPKESTVAIWSLCCANLPVFKSCQKLASKVLSVLCFHIPDRQVISVTRPVPNIQVAWKLVSEAVSFSRCNVLVFVVQEQSEDEQMILVLLFHAEVLWVCFVFFFLKSSIFKIKTLFESPTLLHRVP